MATSSRQTALFGVQDWKRIYQTYREADFQSYDYETLRKSFIDYLTQYYPETFNDYIESSEFVALLDVIAFMGQALAFRGDLNARENFIDTAERRDSVIKLANLVSYTPKRNTAAQGIVKVTSIQTTEGIIDINGTNLSNTTIIWNDPANPYWQEQFNAILNATFVNSQRIGRPGNSQNILGVQTDEYTINIPPGQTPVVPYITSVDGVSMNFELVSATSANQDYLYELPPAPSSQFNILYRNDKLGYSSPNTGFFFYFKQGNLQSYDFTFVEKIQNNFQLIDIENINNTDTWLYQRDANGNILEQWKQVENIFVNANLQGNASAKIFSVTSRTNDQVTYVFGDGVFGEVPVGPFSAYVRSGNATTFTISPSEMNGIVVNLSYISRSNRTETLTLTVSLQTTCNTALEREPLDEIKERAPTRYYTQNRMVNGEDYTNFPFTLFNSIVKSKAINRSSIGVSRNQDLLDPTGKYSSTAVFASDGALYVSDVDFTTKFSILNANNALQFLSQTLPVYLASFGVAQYYQEFFPRYSGVYNVVGSGSIDGRCYWQRLTVNDSTVTGYFYIKTSTADVPIAVGPANSSANVKYLTEGAQLKLIAPAGKYFDTNNRLQNGVPTVTNGGRSFIWVGVESVIGDGFNGGSGSLNNGTGPITLNSFVPTGVYIDTTIGIYNPANKTGATGIIPSFDNTLSNTIVKAILDLIKLKTSNFILYYDNSIPANQERWSIPLVPPTFSTSINSIVLFTYNVADDSYTVTIKNRNYYFGSVDQCKFLFNIEKKVYDPKSGKVLTDYVNVLSTNSNPNYNGAPSNPILGFNYPLFVVGQQVESDGYPDDYAVLVSTIVNNTSYDPDFFTNVIGLPTTPNTRYVFFRIVSDVNDYYNKVLLPVDGVNFTYPTFDAIEAVKYEYPQNTVFFAYSTYGTTNEFYQSQLVPGTQPPVLNLIDVTSEYIVEIGKGAVRFEYVHISGNTTRIDPATTNIIDLYVVVQNYYTAYLNWLNDTTGTVPKPDKPTIDELQAAYGNLDNYKMISDSVVLNSVEFKPLFGTKAAPALQGTIKVVKSPLTTVSDSQIRSSVLAALNSYFTLDTWDFGDTFYFSELSAYLHVQLAGLISSVVVVSNNPNQSFGDLYEIRSAPSEIFVNGATIADIVVISGLTPSNLQRG